MAQNSLRQKILSIGNVSVDIKAYSPEEDNNEAYRDGTIELVPGGVGRGMAVNLKHLGLDSYIFSCVGNDIFGNYLKDGLDETLKHQANTYDLMTEYGWYKTNNVKKSIIEKILNKINDQKN